MRLSRPVLLFDTRRSLSVEPISSSQKRCLSQKQSRINAIIVCTSVKLFLSSRRSFGQVKGLVGPGQACKSLEEDELSGFAILACYDKVTSSLL